jgi:hypothetical protein
VAQKTAVVSGLLSASTSGTADFTVADFGTVAAAIVVISGANSSGNVIDHARLSIGFWDGTTQVTAGIYSRNNVSTGVRGRALRSGMIGVMLDSSSFVLSWYRIINIANGVRIETLGNTSSFRCVVHLIGGVDAHAVMFTPNTADAGTASVSGLSFAPTAMLAASTGIADLTAVVTHQLIAIGAAVKAGNRQACQVLRQLSGSTQPAFSAMLNNRVCGQKTGTTTSPYMDWSLEVTAWNSDGVTCTTRDGATGSDDVAMLLLGGDASIDFGNLTTPTTTGGQRVSTRVAPETLITVFGMVPSPNSGEESPYTDSFGIGMADGTDEYVQKFDDGALLGTTRARSEYAPGAIIKTTDESAGFYTRDLASVSAMDDESFLLDYSIGGTFPRCFLWIAFGPQSSVNNSFNRLMSRESHPFNYVEGWYPMQEASGTTADDASGQTRDGTISGPDVNQSGPGGYLAKAYEFIDANDDVVTLPQDVCRRWRWNNQYTLFAFAKPNVLTKDMAVVSAVDSIGRRLGQIWFDTDGAADSLGAMIHCQDNGVQTAGADDSNTSTNWQSVAAIWDGRELTPFADAVAGTSVAPTYPCRLLDITDSGGGSAVIGAEDVAGGGTKDFDGFICNAMYFSRALLAEDIVELDAGPEPVNTAAPVLSGTATQGQTLSVTNGSWDLAAPFAGLFNGPVGITFQWTRSDDASGTNEADIAGATATMYTLTASDVGKYIRARARASNFGGYDTAEDTNSNFSAIVTAGGGGTTISCTTAAVTLAGLSADIASGTTISCTTAAVTLAGLSADIASGSTISCTTAAVTLAGLSAGVAAGSTISCTTAAVTLAGLSANVTNDTAINCTTAAVTLAGLSADIAAGTTISCTTAAITLAGLSSDIVAGFAINCTTAAVTLAGLSSDIAAGSTISCTTAALTLAGVPCGIIVPVQCTTAAVTLAGLQCQVTDTTPAFANSWTTATRSRLWPAVYRSRFWSK